MTDDTGIRAVCPSCSCPNQLVAMACGFCGKNVPVPAADLNPGGTIKREEVIGWRAWKIARENGKIRLDSPLFGHVWQPGGWEIAECNQRSGGRQADGAEHLSTGPIDLQPPVKGCGGSGHGCGFYAGRTREHLLNMNYGRYSESDLRVIGQVQMSGKVIAATNGWRAQRVRPRVLYVPYELWQLGAELIEEYPMVKVEMSTTMILPSEDAIEWCAKCGAKMTTRSTACGFCGHTHNG